MARYRITTLAPLHIGGQEGQISPFEFVAHGGRTYVLNSQRVAEELRRRNLLDTYVAEAMNENFTHAGFFSANRLLTPEVLNSVASYSSAGGVGPRARELRVFVRDGFARPYIPGSSVKGFFRTALAYAILKSMPDGERRRWVDEYVERELNRLCGARGASRARTYFYRRMEERLFQGFTLRRRERTEKGPHTDLLRCIQVSDSTPVDRNALRVMEIKLHSAGSYEVTKRWSFYAECAPPGTSFDLDITFDERTWRDFAEGNGNRNIRLGMDELRDMLEQPVSVLEKFTSDVLEHERAFFDEEFSLGGLLNFRDGPPNVHLGWGGGMLTTGIALLLPEQLRRRMQDEIFPQRHARPGARSPKSRRLVMSQGKTVAVLGWASIGYEPSNERP